MQTQTIRRRRAAASEYLEKVHGIKRTPATLAKLAVIGGGPKYQLDGRIPLYPQDELDRWAIAKLSPLKASTSDNETKQEAFA